MFPAAKQAELSATLDVGSLWDRMLGEFLGEWDRLQRQGVEGADMEARLSDFLSELSSKPVEDAARKSSAVAYGTGRAEEIEESRRLGLTEYVVRSEVLDQATCERCEALDGAIYEVGSDAFYEFLPPAQCEGGDRCRGFYVAIPMEGP